LHQKLKNLGFQGCAGIALFEYRLFFYLTCVCEGIKTPNLMRFAQKIEDSGFSGVGRNNIFKFYLKWLLARHENTKFCT
jgi:hypothetical protein